ncbi:unnamed protein product [Adineta steineri]|uniref:Uncharacterized protein n=1 Tax=Adineta steineri TaxID=433720 RepID=A0A819DTI2_9BILA|nr:unnamed protein product [Adineta steineri]
MANNKILCFICNKNKITYHCEGCSKEFCLIHLTEYQQILNDELNHIINDYDQFKQRISEQNLHNHSLIKQIDHWERNSIEKIQQKAQQCRETVMKLTQKLIDDVEKKFIELSQKLKEIRQENEFNEIDLNHFQLKLTQITKELLTLPSISIEGDSQGFINKISVHSAVEGIQTKKNQFQQVAITVAGGNGQGQQLDQFYKPYGIFINNDKSIYIADLWNNRIVKWELNSNTGQIIAGENGKGNQNNQLNSPTDIIYDEENNSFLISEWGNQRVIRYSDQNQANQQTIIVNINLRRWKQGDKERELVAGGNGRGNHLNQLNGPTFIFIDKDFSLYISDSLNNRVMKWRKDAKEGIIVAGGNGQGSSLRQLSSPQGVIVDHFGHIYVADSNNHRVMRWCEGDKEGEIVVGGNERGNLSNQLNSPVGLSFDNEENLYVVDSFNHRIQKYEKIAN